MNVECILGEVRLFAGPRCPNYWAFCDGQLLSINDNPALFSLIGTTYGGNGRTTYALPDYRSRILAGQGDGPGLTPRRLGQRFGVETVPLSLAEIPNHNHPFNAATQTANQTSPLDSVLANPGPGAVLYEAKSTADKLKPLASKAVASTGKNYPHANVMPIFAINYIIALRGSYPNRP